MRNLGNLRNLRNLGKLGKLRNLRKLRKLRKCEKILSKIFAILEDFIKQNMNGFAKSVALSPTPYSWALVLGLCPGA